MSALVHVQEAAPGPDQRGATLSSSALLSRTGGDLSRPGGNERFNHPRDGGTFDQELGDNNPRFTLSGDGLRNRQHEPAKAPNTLDVCDFCGEDLRNDNGFDVLRHFGSPRADADELPPAASIIAQNGVVNNHYHQLISIAGQQIEPHAMQFELLAMRQQSLCAGQPRAVSSPLHGERLAAGAGVEGNPIGLGCSCEHTDGSAQRSAQGARSGWSHDGPRNNAALRGLASEIWQAHKGHETDDAVFGLDLEPRRIDARDDDRFVEGRLAVLSVSHGASFADGGAA